MLIVGVDENGLGPQLGPLVATAITIEVDRYEAEPLHALGDRIGVGDSKQTGGFGQMAWTESVALALLQELNGEAPRTMDGLLACLSLDDVGTLQHPCPDGAKPQCWSQPMLLPTFGGDAQHARAVIDELGANGVKLTRLRSGLTCAGRLNQLYATGGTRISADLMLFERLLLDARSHHAEDLHAICGMVGGIRNYGPRFSHIERASVRDAEHTPLSRCYDVQNLGHVRFVIDADANHLPVGLASMVGKYLRELTMERQNRFYRQHEPSLTTGSGYHDPVTKRFVQQSEPLRRRLLIADSCFFR